MIFDDAYEAERVNFEKKISALRMVCILSQKHNEKHQGEIEIWLSNTISLGASFPVTILVARLKSSFLSCPCMLWKKSSATASVCTC